MPVARFEMPDGRIGRFEVPDGTTPEDAQAQISAHIESASKPQTVRDVIREIAIREAKNTPGWQLGLVNLGGGMTDLGQGISQLVRHGVEMLPGVPKGYAGAEEYDKKVAEDKHFRDVVEEVTPGGSIGRATGAAVPTILLPAGKFAEGAGAVLSKIAPAAGAKVAQSALLDAALMSGVQGGAMAAGEGETHLGNAAKGAVAGTATVGALNLLGKAATPLIRWGTNKIIPVATEGAGLAENGALSDSAMSALRNAGINIANYTAQARDRLIKMAEEAVRGVPTSVEELARAARLESLPVPIQGTAGQVSKDFAQNQLEQSLAKNSSAGGPLRQAFADQEDRLVANLDAFKNRTGAKIANEGDAGRSANAAIQARIEKSNANIFDLYRAAEKKGETLEPVDTMPLVNWLSDNGAAAASVPAIKSIADTLKKFGAVKFDEAGNAIAGRPLSINEAEEVRKLAVNLGKADNATGHYMSEAKKVIDKMTEGAGGEAYQAARSARIQHAMEFEEPGVVQNVVGMKSRTDRAVPFEDVFRKTVINGSIDDLKTLKATLLANDKATREAGVQAFKDLRGQAMQFLKDAATNNAYGDTSEAALRRAYNQIGPEKMQELFGGNTAKQFENFLEAVKDLKVAPKGSTNPSGTAGEMVNWVERILGPQTMTGRLGRAAVEGTRKLVSMGEERGQVASAVNAAANREAANNAAALAQQNERVKALLDTTLARNVKRGAAALATAKATD